VASNPLVKTRTPGVYRRGESYVFTYRDRGKQRWGSARTLELARAEKGRRERAAKDGLHGSAARESLLGYLDEWVGRYQGTGRQGFREETRAEYRGMIDSYYRRFFASSLRLAELDPRTVNEFVGWLVKQPSRRGPKGKTLADSTIRNILNPLRAAMATARREGLIVHDPTQDAALPHRPRIDDDEGNEVRALSDEQLDAFLLVVRPHYALLFDFLASTGLRASEAIGLEWRHVMLDDDPHLRIRQRVRRGKAGAPKSAYSRREVALDEDLADDLRALRRGRAADSRQRVFVTPTGKPLDVDNVRKRVIAPAAGEAGVPWCGWHTFRHTCASRQFAAGENIVAVQELLGHHAASFTLDTYVHLFRKDRARPLASRRARAAASQQTPTTL
jgi:integrase